MFYCVLFCLFVCIHFRKTPSTFAAVAEETQTTDETGTSEEKSETEANSGRSHDDSERLAKDFQDNESSDLGASVAETEDNSGSEEKTEKAEKMVADEAAG